MTMQHVSMKFITFKIKNPFQVKHLSTTNSICHCTVLLCLITIGTFTNWTVLSPTMQSSSAIGTSMYTRPLLYKPTHNQIHIMLVLVYTPPKKNKKNKKTTTTCIQHFMQVQCTYCFSMDTPALYKSQSALSLPFSSAWSSNSYVCQIKMNRCKHEEKNCLSHSNKNCYKDNGITGTLCHQAPRSPKPFAL